MEIKIGAKSVSLTRREIDILACILNGRGIKKSAHLLQISPKTVDAHIRTLMLKLECHCREALIDCVEQAETLDVIKNRYQQLLEDHPAALHVNGEELDREKIFPLSSIPLSLSQEEGEEVSHRQEGRAPQRNFYKEWVLNVRKKVKEKKLFVGKTLGLIGLSLMGGFLLLKAFFLVSLFETKSLEPFIFSNITLPHEDLLLQRSSLLKEIEEKLGRGKGIKKVILLGVGGSGKTTLARHYARSQKASLIWEINGEGSIQIRMSLNQLAQVLAQTEEAVKELKKIHSLKLLSQKDDLLLTYLGKKLKNYPEWILSVDNVVDFSQIRKYLPTDPSRWGPGKIILTTQNAALALHEYIKPDEVINVQEMLPEEKERLFISILSGSSSNYPLATQETSLKEFLQKIPSFPLDVSAAAYYLKLTLTPYKAYLSLMEHSYKDFNELQENILKEVKSYTKTRYGIVSVSLQNLIKASKENEDLLVFLSLIDSQDIPKNLLIAYQNRPVVDKFIYQLRKYSLITHEGLSPSLGPFFSLHHSTQKIILSYMTKTLALEKGHPLVPTLFSYLEHYITNLLNQEATSHMPTMINHCEKFLSHSHLLKGEIRGALESKLGGLYFHLGDYRKAHALLEKSLAAFEQNPQRNALRMVGALDYLGEVYNDKGDYEKARLAFEKALSLYRQYFPGSSQGVPILEKLGNVYNGLGTYEKAQEALGKALSFYKTIPRSHKEQARTLARLAITLRELGDYKKAKALDEESLTLYETHFPQNRIRMARQLASLGHTSMYLGETKASQHLLEKSLKIYKEELSPHHIYTTWAFIFLGNTYKKLGDYKKASEILEEKLSICEKHYGENHIKIAEILRDLGEIYSLLGNLDRGEKLIVKALKIFKAHHHPSAYTALESLADLYKRKTSTEKDFSSKDRVVACLKEALEILSFHFPPSSPHRIRVLAKLEDVQTNRKGT